MKENKLIASVVVFKELLDSNKDIYDIIAEFLKAGILDQKKISFTPTELKKIIEKVFDFKLPEAVIKSTLKNRLVKSKFVTYNKGEYVVNNVGEEINPDFEKNYETKKEIYKKTEKDFIDFIENRRNKSFSEKEKNKVKENINHYLLGNAINEPYTQDISAFIIENKTDKKFTERLNIIKEGIVLYTGIRYTADFNELGKWNKPLTIFLDTEILFYFMGYSGIVYKEIFNDFLKLVREINQKSSADKKIKLKYFKETEKEILKFFYVAELIIDNKITLDPSKTAMKEILMDCQTKSDLIVKKNRFFLNLKTSGIEIEEDKDYYENPMFNIESPEVIDELNKISKENYRDFDEESCKNYLKLFTKLNVLRKGVSNLGFENCKFILLTGNRYIHYLANNSKIKINERDIPFATDLDFITDKFWFKLKKGFGNSEDTPKSFDFITKAQIVLSSQINNTVQEKYSVLNEEYKNGKITKQEAISLTYELRESCLKPEEITEINIEDSITFINNYSIENHLREKEILNQKVKEGQKAQDELKRRDLLIRTKKIKLIKIGFRFIKGISVLISLLSILVLYYLYYLLINYFKVPGDSPLSIISFVLGIIFLIPFWKYIKKVNIFLNTFIRKRFAKKISKLFHNDY